MIVKLLKEEEILFPSIQQRSTNLFLEVTHFDELILDRYYYPPHQNPSALEAKIFLRTINEKVQVPSYIWQFVKMLIGG